MDLIKYDKLKSVLPMKAFPKDGEELNAILLIELMPFISGLLSLTDEVSANRLEIAMPSVKEHCWSMGFAEIRKMFQMYADNKLSIKPIPNYFDTILLGKIVEAYKQQKPRKKPVEYYTSPDEIEFIMTEAIDRIQKDYQQNGCITEMCHHVYDHLYEKNVLQKHTQEYRTEIKRRAVLIYETEPIEDDTMLKKIISNFSTTQKNDVKNISKRLVLEDYFKTFKAE